LTDKFEKDLIS